MQSRIARRRKILKQTQVKKIKLSNGQQKEIEDDFEDMSEEDEEQIEFEDEFDDEYEKEAGSIELDSEEEEQLIKEQEQEQQQAKVILKRKDQKNKIEQEEKRVWFNDNVEVDNLDFDNRAYNMLHRVNTEWPCLSCDYILPPHELELYANKQFQKMNKYPYTVYLCAGTQAGQPSKNQIYLMKLSQLHKTKYDDDESQDGDSEDDNISNDEEGQVELQAVSGLKYSVNRIKSMNYQPIVAFQSESSDVTIVDLKPVFQALEQGINTKFNINQLQHQSFKNQAEGFALSWSPFNYGQLISGQQDCKIQLYTLSNQWTRDNKPYQYHQGSVEDLQFSPIEPFAFASCSVDGTVGVVDMRVGKKKEAQILIKAHDCDVNVISWNQVSTNLLASGGDDGQFKVWDLRYPKNDSISDIQFHNQPITSIQFQPNSDSTLAVSSADNKLSIWDFAVENDQNEEGIPDQLMFVHQGQKDLKELRYHPIYTEMITSTSGNGFNVFKPTLDEEDKSSEEDEDEQEIPKINEEDLDKYFGKLQI